MNRSISWCCLPVPTRWVVTIVVAESGKRGTSGGRECETHCCQDIAVLAHDHERNSWRFGRRNT
jgi:hypothetical protein